MAASLLIVLLGHAPIGFCMGCGPDLPRLPDQLLRGHEVAATQRISR